MESDSKSGGPATAVATATGSCGRLLVDESSSDVPNDRRRFQIDLKHGETTIVSWVQLLKESGLPVDQSLHPSPEPPKWFHEEDDSRTEYANTFLKREKEEQKSPTKEHCQPKKQRTNISQGQEKVNDVQLTKITKMGHARVKSSTCRNYNNKLKSESHCAMASDGASVCADISEEHSVNNERNELPDLNVPYTEQTTDGLSNMTMELQVKHKAKYSMDHEMEDKICDFYDIYVQLASLWPKGTMDNHGIQNAICRAKECRTTTLLQQKGHGKGKRKKANLNAEVGRPINDHNAPIQNFVDIVVPGTCKKVQPTISKFLPWSVYNKEV